MTLVGLEYLRHQETQRANRANEDLKRFDVQSRVTTADKDRYSRENVANLDRSSKESIAYLDRSSREDIAAADRMSRENIAAADRQAREDVAILNNQAQYALQDYKYQEENAMLDKKLRHTELENKAERALKRETNQLNFDIAHMQSKTKWGTDGMKSLVDLIS